MEENKSGLFKIAKLAPPLTEEQAFLIAHDAVQNYLSMIKMDEEKIDEFNSI
jgi:hypothetical protein